jgi:hypothetical protein
VTDVLNIRSLADRHPSITEAVGAAHEEAACVCLDRHHISPIEVEIEFDPRTCVAIAQWQKTDDRARGAWATKTTQRNGARRV